MENTPTWLLSVMGKSGLFRRWAIKMAEVIVWFYRGRIGGGFTYWPDGPARRAEATRSRRCGIARSSSRTR